MREVGPALSIDSAPGPRAGVSGRLPSGLGLRHLPRREVLPAILLLALSLRLAALYVTGAHGLGFGDAQDYLDTARFVCQHGDYPQQGNLPFLRAPLYPLLLALVTGCDPGLGLPAALLGPLLDVGTVAALYFLARRLGRAASMHDTRVAVIAALFAATYPVFIYQSLDLRSEPLFMLLLVLTLLAFLRRRFLLTGLCLGLAALARPTALALLPFFVAALALQREHVWREKLRAAALLVITFCLILAPWVAFNLHKHGEWILVNDAAGYNFWRGSHPEMYHLLRLERDEDFASAATRFEAETTAAEARQIASQATTPLGRSRRWFVLGLENITRHPETYLRFTLWKLAAYWRPWLQPARHGTAAVVASALCFVPLYLLGAAGLVRTWRRDPRLVQLALLFFLWTWLVQVPFQVVVRFRIPFVDPLMVAFAAIAVVAASSRKLANRQTLQ